MIATIGNVVIRPLAEKKRLVEDLSDLGKDDLTSRGVIMSIGDADGINVKDEALVVGREVLIPKIGRQEIIVGGLLHYICHYAEIRCYYD